MLVSREVVAVVLTTSIDSRLSVTKRTYLEEHTQNLVQFWMVTHELAISKPYQRNQCSVERVDAAMPFTIIEETDREAATGANVQQLQFCQHL